MESLVGPEGDVESICGYQVEGKGTNECSLPVRVSGETSDQQIAQQYWLSQTLQSMRSMVDDSGFGNRYTINFSVPGKYNVWVDPTSTDYFQAPDEVSMDLNTVSTWAMKTMSIDLAKVKSDRVFVSSSDGKVFESFNSFMAVGEPKFTYQLLNPNQVAVMSLEIKATDQFGNVITQGYTYQLT